MSKSAQLAQGTKLYIAGSAGSAEPLTAVTVGYPTIIAMTGHAGVANGDVVTFALFAGVDAATLNGQTAVVHSVATGATNDTFAVNINTVGKTITIGTATATPALWTQIKEMKSLKPSGASASKIDVTDLDSVAMESRTGLVDNGSFTIELNILESDPGQAAAEAAFEGNTVNSYKITTVSKTRTFDAVCTKFPIIPDAAVNGVQTGTAEFQISGDVTIA